MRGKLTHNKFLICLVIMLCLMPQLIKAQKKSPINLPFYDHEPHHYGFILGYNQMLLSTDFIDNYQNLKHESLELPSTSSLPNKPFYVYEIIPQIGHGFTVGIVGNLRLAKYFDLRFIPSLSFGNRKVVYKIKSIEKPQLFTLQSNTHSTFIEFPLQVKYRAKRFNNLTAYIIAGVNYKIDMASQKKNYDDNRKPINITVKRNDIAAEIGAGFDFYTGYFKLGIEIKMSYGFLNILKKEDVSVYSNSFNNLRNKTFQLSFTFE